MALVKAVLKREISARDLRACDGVHGERFLIATKKSELEEQASRMGLKIVEFEIHRTYGGPDLINSGVIIAAKCTQPKTGWDANGSPMT